MSKQPKINMAISEKIDKKKVKRGIKITVFVILAIAISLLSYWTFGNFSTGNRVGNVFKISNKGVMFKTWEGQLNTGAVSFSEDKDGIWKFSVPKSKKEVLEAIDQAMIDNKRVKLYYNQKYVTLPWRGDTDYLVYKVEVLEK